MIKNPHLLKELEKRDQKAEAPGNWYEKADALCEVAVSLNPEVLKKGGEEHIAMLINVREKMKTIKNRSSSA